jgi:hypothetical protein
MFINALQKIFHRRAGNFYGQRQSMSEHNLFQEVEDDLERQKLEGLWKKYGFWVITAALGVVISTASSTAYRTWKIEHNRKVTYDLLSANRETMDISKNVEMFQKFAEINGDEKHAALALLRAGALSLETDKAKAAGYFDQLANDEKADPVFRQLGSLLSVQAQLDSGEPEKLSQRLQPLTAQGAAWRYSALEGQGYLALRAGDAAKARTIFAELSRDERAPRSIAARAIDILRTLN